MGQLSYVDDGGQQRRHTVYGRTRQDVLSKMREVRQRLDAGEPVTDATMLLSAWLEEWISGALEASDRKRSTKDLYAGLARTHLAPAPLGIIPLDKLRPSDVERLIVRKRDAGLATSTVRTIYTVLRAALDVATRDGLIRRNVAATVKRPAVKRQDAMFLTADAARKLLDVVAGDRLEALYRLLLATGLRRGEGLALHWSDVDLEAGSLRVRWTLGRTSRGLELDEPKTEKSRRVVPLPRSAVETLRVHRKRQLAERLAAPVWHDSDLLFTTEIGTMLEPRNVLRWFKKLATAAGVPSTTLHTLRHSTASLLLAAGTHTKVVQEHLGHSSYAITADIYSHVAPAQAREAADRLDAAVEW
jgi:integrase